MDTENNNDKDNEKAALYIAIILTTTWVLGIGIIFYLYPDSARQISYDQNLTALIAVGLFLPLILIWIAAVLSRSLSAMQNETVALRKSVEQMNKTLEVQIVEESETRDRWIQSQLAQITAHTKQTDSHVSELADKALEDRGKMRLPRNTTAMPGKSGLTKDTAQANLPLPDDKDTSDEPITIRELIKALNFPDNAKDTEGFRVLQRAFNDHNTSKLLHSAQDVLTMLSEDGIYMDDMRIDKPAPSAWRSFAKGARGKEIAGLGMVRDRTALALATTRLKNDSKFRETVHGFLTQFDTILTEFERAAEDGELTQMGKTRSAVAFMLLGRISGAFDAR
jgi:hypothetical protein